MSGDDEGRQGAGRAAKAAESASDPLKDGLKAVAGEGGRSAQPVDPERTAIINRGAAAGQGKDPGRLGVLQDALKAVEAALGTTPTKSAAGGSAKPATEVPPTLAIRTGERASRMEHVKTQIVRGQQKPSRTDFHQEPVVAWLVVIGGPGLGAFRPVFEGNNTIGRSAGQRIPINFGDDTISGEEQAYLRYDSVDRQFLFVPNLAKTNVVHVNDLKPTSAVRLSAMDVITIGKTQLVFVPFCGPEFDWSELADLEG